VLDEPAEPHPEYASDDPFPHAIKTWSAPPVEVRIRISARKAPFVPEYPLKGASLEAQPDGTLLVRATVAGLQEVSKWILSWGRDATALAPPDLRKLLHDELAAALAPYQQD
jgi:proteasome accessory factor B